MGQFVLVLVFGLLAGTGTGTGGLVIIDLSIRSRCDGLLFILSVNITFSHFIIRSLCKTGSLRCIMRNNQALAGVHCFYGT